MRGYKTFQYMVFSDKGLQAFESYESAENYAKMLTKDKTVYDVVMLQHGRDGILTFLFKGDGISNLDEQYRNYVPD